MKRRILSALLSLCMILTLLPGTALAAGDVVAYPVTGGNIYFNKASATITSSDYGIINAVIPSTIDGIEVQTIGMGAFRGSRNLKSVYIPQTVTAIDYDGNPFAGCTVLSSISVDPNNQSFCSLDGALYRFVGTGIDYRSSLELMAYPAENAAPGTLDFQVPDNVVEIWYDAFLPNHSLNSITITKNVKSVGEKNENIIGAQKESPFEACSFLTAIHVVDDNEYYSSSEGVLFDKSKTTLIAYPRAKQSDTYLVPDGITEITAYAFHYAEKLTSICIPEGIKRIGSSAFSGCKRLAYITIPSSTTELGSSVFFGDDNLTDIYYGGSEGQWQALYNQHNQYNQSDLKGVTVHYNSTGPDDPTNPDIDPENPNASAESIRFFKVYDSSTRAVGFDADEVPLNRLAATVDVSGIEQLVGQYVLVTKNTEDPLEITDIKPVESKIGTVEAVGEHTLTVGGATYPVNESLKLLLNINQKILYHVYSGGIEGYSVVEQKTGVLENWNGTSRVATIDRKDYPTNYLTDLSFLASLDNYVGHKVNFEISGNNGYTPVITVTQYEDVGSKWPISFDMTQNKIPLGSDITISATISNGSNLQDSDITWMSDNNTIALVTSNSISYSGDTAIATATVRGVAIGKAVISITCTIDNRNASVTIEVVPNVSNFNPTLYRADYLQQEGPDARDVEYINDQINKKTPSQELIQSLQESGFQDSIVAWKSFELISDSLDDITALWDFVGEPKDLYSAIILNALEASVSYDVIDGRFEDAISDCDDFVAEMKSLMETQYGIDIRDPSIFKLMPMDQRKSLAKSTEDWFKRKQPDLCSLDTVFSNFTKVFGAVGSIEDYLERIVSCCILVDTTESMKAVLKRVYQDSLSSDNLPLQLALLDCVDIMNSSSTELYAKIISDEMVVIGEGVSTYLIKELLWKQVTKTLYATHPAVAIFQTAYKTGKYISNLLFNTDDTYEQYLKMLAISDVEHLTDKSYGSLKAEYTQQRDVFAAEVYLSALDLVFTLRDNDTVNAYDFVDILDQTLVNKVFKLFGKDTYAEQKDYLRLLQKNYYGAYEEALTYWIEDLEKDYPNTGLYEYYHDKAEQMRIKLEMTKEFVAACPIDVYVYDESGQLIASIVDDCITCNGDIMIGLLDDCKIIRFYEGQNYRIEYVGTDTGDMDIAISEFDSNENIIRTVNYYDIALTNAVKYSVNVDESLLVPVPYEIKEMATGKVLSPDYDSLLSSDTIYSVSVRQGTMNYNGEITLSTDLSEGVNVDLHAYVPEGYQFVRWEASNGEDIFEDKSSPSTAFIMPAEDITIRAIIQVDEAVAIPVTEVSLSPTSVSLATGTKAALTATVTPADAENRTVIWTSNDPSVATVDANGIVTAVSTGNAIITASTLDGGYTASCMVSVSNFSDDNPGGMVIPSTSGTTTVPSQPDTPDTPIPWANPFTDVSQSDWYYDAVAYVCGKGLMNGVSATQFNPSGTTTRGMIMTILARLDGTDTTGSDPWYQKGMQWAVAAGVSDGSSPEGTISREQLATMLWRFAGEPAASGAALAGYPDAANVSDWASSGIAWAVANGIISGTGTGALNPQGTATRAEAAVMLMRFCELMNK